MNELLLLDTPPSLKDEVLHHPCEGDHQQRLLAVRDAIDIISGKWKIQLIALLLFKGKMRFTDLRRNMPGIAAKMLSKDLHELEVNQLVTRTVLQTKPVTVEYEATEYGRSLEPVILEISQWGIQHRRKIMAG